MPLHKTNCCPKYIFRQIEKDLKYLKEQFDENSGRTSRVVFVKFNDRQNEPAYCVGEEKMSKNLGHVPQLPDLQPVHSLVRVHEDLLPKKVDAF